MIKRSPVAEEAIKRMNIAVDADEDNRQEAIDNLNFSHGKQWPAEIEIQRKIESRPCLTINKTDTFVRAVVNNMRQQRPRIKVHPVSDGADVQKSTIIEGLLRHIEVQSNAELAYDTAADFQVRMGWGYWRVTARYEADDSFDQDLYIDRVRNPFSVYFDPSSTSPDGLDAKWCVITDRIKKSEFKRLYPSYTEQDFTSSGAGDGQAAWSSKEETMIAEYWRIEDKADVLFELSNGKNVFKSECDAKDIGDMTEQGMVIDKRDTTRRVVKWSKVTKTQELEAREWPGKYIPIIPCYGSELLVDGKLQRSGMVRNLKDPQKMYNFWRTQETEFVALAPKAPWLVAEGQIENHESEWATANIKNHSTLTYKPVSDPETGQLLPPPQRLQPQSVPAASVNAAMSASEDLKAVAGMFDPALGAAGNETSGTMVAQRQMQSDKSNYHFYDNLTRSIRATGIILLDLLPHYYNGERSVRIIGSDGSPDTVTINEQQVDSVLNDVCTGRYDVVMATGPGYDTKRMEATESLINLTKVIPNVMQQAADIIVGQMDFPMAQELAQRLKMANPIAQAQDQIPKDVDPKAQQMIGQLMGQLHQAQKQLQELTQEKQAKIFGLQQKSQDEMQRQMQSEIAETHRTEIREHGDNYRAELAAHTKMSDVHSRDNTSMHETLIDSQTDLQIAHHQSMNRGKPNPATNI